MYNGHTQNYLREVSSDPPDEVTEILNEMETTNDSIGGSSIGNTIATTEVSSIGNTIATTEVSSIGDTTATTEVSSIGDTTATTEVSSIGDTTATTEATSGQMAILDDTTPTMGLTTTIPTTTTILTTTLSPEGPTESSQTVLIVLGLLLAVLVIVCCVLACIFAKIRRKGFCTVEGRNQATCDDDCQENGVTLQQSPKASMSSGKLETSRSSDKLLTE